MGGHFSDFPTSLGFFQHGGRFASKPTNFLGGLEHGEGKVLNVKLGRSKENGDERKMVKLSPHIY